MHGSKDHCCRDLSVCSYAAFAAFARVVLTLYWLTLLLALVLDAVVSNAQHISADGHTLLVLFVRSHQSQVGRLHKQRAQFRARGREALEQMGRVQAVLDNIDIDFSVSFSSFSYACGGRQPAAYHPASRTPIFAAALSSCDCGWWSC